MGREMRDSAEREQAEEELRRYEQIVSSTTDMLALVDQRYVYLAANTAYLRTIAKPADEVIGRTVAEVFGEEFFRTVIRPRAERCLAGEEIRFQVWYEFPANGRRCMDVAYAPYIGPENQVLGFVVTARDITDRKRAEEALRQERDFNARLIASTPAFFVAIDAEGKTRMMNEAMLAALGYRHEEIADRDYLETFVPEREREQLAKVFQRLVELREATLNENHIIAKDGRELLVEWHGNPSYRADGDVAFFFGVGIDITERRRAEQERQELEAQLRQSQKMEAVGLLAGGIAHDFNNILTTILGNVDLSMESVRRELGADHNVAAAMKEIEQAAERAAALTRQLLTFSRRDVMQPRILNLNTILTNLDRMLRRLVTENITLETVTESELKSVRADAGHVEQIIVNLVVNAVQAMPEGGRLTLETNNVTLGEAYTRRHAEARPGPHVLLAVSDTGSGMDPTTRERIFEPFFTTKSTETATGLGLATVHGIVKQSGGHIMVYSEPGRGTTFKVFLPAIDAAPAERTSTAPANEAQAAQETVLLCEDDRPVRELIAESLRTAGYTVMTASCGQEGIAAAENHAGSLDLLITDVIMPDMNGRALSECLQAMRPDLPTLFMSGYTSNVIAHHGVLSEGVEFLEKPFTREHLLAKVRELLNQTRSEG